MRKCKGNGEINLVFSKYQYTFLPICLSVASDHTGGIKWHRDVAVMVDCNHTSTTSNRSQFPIDHTIGSLIKAQTTVFHQGG